MQRGSTYRESNGRDLLQGDESHVSLRLDYRKHDPLKHPPERLVSSGVSVVAVVYSQSGGQDWVLRRCYRSLFHREPQGLPYLQTNRVGRLSYVRRIAPELQIYAGNQKIIRRSLGLSNTNQADLLVITAWSRVHQEAEMLPEQELAQHQGEPGSLKAHQPKELRLNDRQVGGTRIQDTTTTRTST